MKKICFGLAFSLYCTSALALTQEVPAGQTVSNGMVDSIFTQNVYGTTNDYSILGTQNVMSGGVANNSYLYSYAQQNVMSGGVATGTNIQRSAIQTVSGESFGSLVNSSGSMKVNSGGKASDTIVNGGSLSVLGGGEADGTILKSGNFSVAASATATNTQINSGTMKVYGVDENAVLNGGLQVINSGATASGTQIYGGRQEVDGSAVATSLFGGRQIVFSGASLSDAVVEDGRLEMSSGSNLNGLTLNGGKAEIASGVNISGVTTLNGGVLSNLGDNTIADLQMNGGTVKMSGGYSRLTVNNLEGSGNFYLKSEADISLGDELVVKAGSGNFAVSMIDYSVGEEFPADIPLIKSDSPDTKFYLTGGAVDIGAFRYDLAQVGDQWFLQKTPIASDTSVIAKNTFVAVSSIFYSHLNSLGNRFGDLRFNKKSGFWIHGLGRNMHLSFDDGTKSRVNMEGVQIGFDKEIEQDFVADWRVGLFAGYSDARQKFDRNGRGDADTQSFGVYTTLGTASGWYGDFSSTYYRHKQKVQSYLPTGDDVYGSYDLDGWSVSAQVGKRWMFKELWFAEPQLQLSYLDLQDVDYRTNYNTRVEGNYGGATMVRAGVMLGRRFDDYLDFPMESFVSFSLLHDFDGQGKVSVAGYEFTEDLSGSSYELGLGVNAEVKEKFSLYAKVNTLWGDRLDVPFDINFGLKYEF